VRGVPEQDDPATHQVGRFDTIAFEGDAGVVIVRLHAKSAAPDVDAGCGDAGSQRGEQART
jgi:hypothetical protein